MVKQMASLGCFPEADWFGRTAGEPGGQLPDGGHLDRPAVRAGVVLIGDADGRNGPIIGQGLSIAVRDVGLVAAALLGTTAPRR